jgi:tryptophan synthase alpha chain
MKRLTALFQQKRSGVLNVYCTAGYPSLNSTMTVMQSLQANGADIIELGMPYSDPLADGEVIQASSAAALANGMTIDQLFIQLKDLRKKILVPVILMGYMNPVLQFGFEKFCSTASVIGIDGLILPDLPMYEFETEYGSIIKKYGLDMIFLITPETSEERIRRIDDLGSGFVYAVSSSSTTGNNKPLQEQQPYFEKLKNMQLKNPVLVGFGINNRETFETACRHTNGAIIGSAYIKALANADDIDRATKDFLHQVI